MTRVLVVLGISAIPLLLYLPFLSEPFLKDEGFYAATAQIIRDGGLPYRDAFDNKPPLIFGWFALSFEVFGETLWAPRLMAAICVSATVPVIYAQGRTLFTHRAGVIAALAFALSIGIADFQTNANTEYFLLLPMSASLLTFTLGARSGGIGWFLAAGFFAALAIMTKQVAVFNFLALVAMGAMWGRWGTRPRLKGRVISVAGLTAGCVVGLALVSAPFLASGSFADLFEGVVTYALGYSNDVSTIEKAEAMLFSPLYLIRRAGPWIVLALLGIACAWKIRREKPTALAVAWLAASCAGVLATGRFYDHYYVQLLPALALMAPLGIAFLEERWDRRWVRVIGLFVLPLSVFIPLVVSLNVYLQPTPEDRHLAKFQSAGIGDWEVESVALGAYLQRQTDENDYIYNLGFQSELYFYADRKSPTRFLFDHAFPVDAQYEAEALADLEANPPAMIVDSARYEPDDRIESAYYAESIKEFIDDSYEYLGKFYYADIYRLKGAP